MSCIDWMKVPWGVPSATRLKKALEDVGFDGLKNVLPQGAVEGLYDGKGGDSRSGLLAAQFHKQASSSSKHYQSLLLLVRHQHRYHLRNNNLHQPPHLVQHQTHRWKIQAQLLLLEVVDLDQQQNGGRIYAACSHRFCIGNA